MNNQFNSTKKLSYKFFVSFICVYLSFYSDKTLAQPLDIYTKIYSRILYLDTDYQNKFVTFSAEHLGTEINLEQPFLSNQVENNPDLINYPYIEGVLDVSLFYDGTIKASDSDHEISDLFTEIEFNANTFFTPNLYLNTVAELEPVLDQKLGENRWFGDHGISVSSLNINYETNRFFVAAGKGKVNFAIATNAVGIWGADIIDDQVKVSSRLGIAGDVGFSLGNWGNHAVSASFFFADTTFLSESLITNKGRKKREDGGASNTGIPESFAIALDGNNFQSIPNLRYHLAFMRQAVDKIKVEGESLPDKLINDEYRIAFGLEMPVQINDNFTITPLIEYVHFWNAEGLIHDTADYLTSSIGFNIDQWNLALASTLWWLEEEDQNTNIQLQVSGGYVFESTFAIDLGYRYLDEEGVSSHTLGIWLSYGLNF